MEKDFKLKINLPASWAKGTISEMISGQGVFVDGDWIESKDQDQNGDVRLIQLADIGDGKFRDKSSRFLTLQRANEIGCTFLREGDVLVARMPDPIGRACIFPLKGEYKYVTAVDVAIIRPGENGVNNKWLNYTINTPTIRNKIEALQSGTTRKRISRGNLALIEFPIPPRNEQNRIVEKLDELLSELEKGKEQLQTALEHLKVYRQSVLKSAFEGTLTNENLKEGELPEGWKSIELNEIAERIADGPFGSHLKSSDYVDHGIRVIRLENIGEMEFKDEYKTFVTPNKYETIKRHTVTKGDIIFSSFVSDSIRTTILPDYIDNAINKADCFLVRVSHSKILAKYLMFYFSTRSMRNQLVDHVHGATRPRINTTQLRNSLIPVASLGEQHLVVQEIESRLSVCDKLEETINECLGEAEVLRKSILKKAFEGKLVDQDLGDEPASKLLESIRKEKLNAQKTKKRIAKEVLTYS